MAEVTLAPAARPDGKVDQATVPVVPASTSTRADLQAELAVVESDASKSEVLKATSTGVSVITDALKSPGALKAVVIAEHKCRWDEDIKAILGPGLKALPNLSGLELDNVDVSREGGAWGSEYHIVKIHGHSFIEGSRVEFWSAYKFKPKGKDGEIKGNTSQEAISLDLSKIDQNTQLMGIINETLIKGLRDPKKLTSASEDYGATRLDSKEAAAFQEKFKSALGGSLCAVSPSILIRSAVHSGSDFAQPFCGYMILSFPEQYSNAANSGVIAAFKLAGDRITWIDRTLPMNSEKDVRQGKAFTMNIYGGIVPGQGALLSEIERRQIFEKAMAKVGPTGGYLTKKLRDLSADEPELSVFSSERFDRRYSVYAVMKSSENNRHSTRGFDYRSATGKFENSQGFVSEPANDGSGAINETGSGEAPSERDGDEILLKIKGLLARS